MPNPSNANALDLGGALMDLSSLTDEDCSPRLRRILQNQYFAWLGAGCPSGLEGAGPGYLAVYATDAGGAVYDLWGGNPSDPQNPHPLATLSAGSGGTTYTAGLYLILTGNEFAVDLTAVSGYNGSANQYLKNEAGTIKWVTVAECAT